MEKITEAEVSIRAFISDLVDNFDDIDEFFIGRPTDYLAAKEAWEKVLVAIASKLGHIEIDNLNK